MTEHVVFVLLRKHDIQPSCPRRGPKGLEVDAVSLTYADSSADDLGPLVRSNVPMDPIDAFDESRHHKFPRGEACLGARARSVVHIPVQSGKAHRNGRAGCGATGPGVGESGIRKVVKNLCWSCQVG